MRLFARAAVLLTALAGCAPVTVPPGQPAPDIRVASYNIKHGRGNDEIVDLERTAGVLCALAPDIVGLQEVDNRVARSGGVDEPERLGALLGLHHAFGAFMPYQGGEYGMAILSRYPIASTRAIPLPDGHEPRVALVVEVTLPDGRALTVVNVHFDWADDDGFRFAQATTLSTELDRLTTPYVLLGDFNDVPESRTLSLFRERAEEAAKPTHDRLTFPSTGPEKEIDYIFYSPASQFTVREVRVIDEPMASDHRPVLAVVNVAATSAATSRVRQ